jgi:ATP-binding cassette, subfamily B (MDR/TAP), member 1
MRRRSPLGIVPDDEGPTLVNVKAVELKNLSFRYPSRPQQLVLADVSLCIPAKQINAIVGLSGSGKSTMASLIPRLYDFESGAIHFDEYDIRDMNLHSLRSLIAVVEQSTSLLQGSILENVAAGLLTSRKHTHLHSAILDRRLYAVAQAVQGGESLKTASTDSEVREVVHLVENAVELAEALFFVQLLQHG